MTTRFNLIDTIRQEPKFSKFSSYIKMSGADAILRVSGRFTIFVPSDEAFAKIPDAEMNALLQEAGQERLKALLSYHILPGKIMAASIGSESVRTSVTGEEITFTDNRGIKVNGIGVLRRNIEATNGVVHSLDTILARPVPLSDTSNVPLRATSLCEPDEDVDSVNFIVDTSRPIF